MTTVHDADAVYTGDPGSATGVAVDRVYQGDVQVWPPLPPPEVTVTITGGNFRGGVHVYQWVTEQPPGVFADFESQFSDGDRIAVSLNGAPLGRWVRGRANANAVGAGQIDMGSLYRNHGAISETDFDGAVRPEIPALKNGDVLVLTPG